MTYNWVDVIAGLLIIAAFFRGYHAGLIATLLSAVGYVLGGLTGLILSMHFVKGWLQVWSKIGLILTAIFFAAAIGEYLFRRVAKFFHSKILFGPFKWLDSVAGGIFSVLRSLIIFYLVSALLIFSPWVWAQKNVPTSQIYTQIHKYAPEVITKITTQIESTLTKKGK